MEESVPAVSVSGLTKRFGEGEETVTAVDDVSFTIPSGSVVGVLGPNGAGKTTLFKSILGLVVPEEGTVEIEGIDVYDAPRAAHERLDAMLEGARNNYWRLTVEENLQYFAGISGGDPETLLARCEDLLERFGLADRRQEVVRNLSRGMKQRVSLASVLATNGSVVFIDEPTLGLDIESAITLRVQLQRIIDERDLTVVLSSHDMDVVEDVCDRVIIMQDGEIVAENTVEELRELFGTRGYRITVDSMSDDVSWWIRADFPAAEIATNGEVTEITLSTDSNGLYRLVQLFEEENISLLDIEMQTPDLERTVLEVTRTE